MSAADVDVLDLAAQLADATFYERDVWLAVIQIVGGAKKARYLIEATGQPLPWFTPELLQKTAMAVVLLEQLPDLSTSP